MVQIKVVQNWISYKQLSWRISLFLLRVELGGSNDCHFWNILMYWNGKVDSPKGWLLQKILVISKIYLNKNCSELTVVRKNNPKWAEMGQMSKKSKSESRNTSKYTTNLWMWNSWWGFLEGYLRMDTIDTFAKISIKSIDTISIPIFFGTSHH